MQAFECTGQWWLPGKEKDRAAGTLKVSQSGDLRLWLVGSLGPAELLKPKGYPIILGWVDKSPVGDIVTLSGCMMGGSTVGSSITNRENYYASQAYFGAHFEAPGNLMFRTMSLYVAGLSDWAHDYSGFVDEGFPSEKPKAPTPVLSYMHKKPLFVNVPGGQLAFGVRFSSRASHRERSFRESVGVSISCETAKSSDQFNGEYVYPFQNLMTFVCDRPQEVEDFSVRTTEDAPGSDIRVIGPRVLPEEDEGASEVVRYFQMLFTLADVDFSDFIGKWLRVTKRYEDACSMFFGLQYGPPAFLDMTFPGVVQSLSLYYSRRDDGVAGRSEGERRLKEILSALPTVDADWVVDRLGARPFLPVQLVLRKLVEEHSDTMNPLVSSRQDRFVNEVINTLNYIAFREEEMNSAARHGAALYWMMQKLRFLFKSCLLQELGFNKEKVTELLRRNALYQHVCGLEAAEEAQRQKT